MAIEIELGVPDEVSDPDAFLQVEQCMVVDDRYNFVTVRRACGVGDRVKSMHDEVLHHLPLKRLEVTGSCELGV